MKKIIIYISIVLYLGTSCNPNILDYEDPNSYDTKSYFKTPEEIQQAANATYSALMYSGFFGFRWHELFDLQGCEAIVGPGALGGEVEMIPFSNFEYDQSSYVVSNFWKFFYRVILRANLTIDKGNEYLAKNGDDAMVTRSIGEAYFLRGWSYTMLAFNFGRVPLRLQYDQSGNETASRSNTVDEVWAVAEDDFKQAQSLLPASWSGDDLGRATAGAATGFLGKLYLYTKQYDKAEAEFAKMTGYTLNPAEKWYDQFSERNRNSVESVFEVQLWGYPGTNAFTLFDEAEGPQASPVGRSNLHHLLYGFNDWVNFGFPTRRMNDFRYTDESGASYVDPRAKLTFYEEQGGIGDSIWCEECPDGKRTYTQTPYYKKLTNYEYTEGYAEYGIISNNIILMRWADVLLMRAECALQGNSRNVAAALGYINQVRNRIGAFPYQGTYTTDQTFELLKRERQMELMGEQHRFNDIRRWNILKETLDVEMGVMGKSPINPKYYLFPIPQTEIDLNPGFGAISNNWN